MYCLLFYTCIKMLSNDGKICFAITYKNGKTLNGVELRFISIFTSPGIP